MALFGSLGIEDPQLQQLLFANMLGGMSRGFMQAGAPSRMPTGLMGSLAAGLGGATEGMGQGLSMYGGMQRNKLIQQEIKKAEQERKSQEDSDRYFRAMGQDTGTPAAAPEQMPEPKPTPMVPMGPDNKLAQAVEWQESRGNPNAVSPKGAVGSMQTMPATLRDPGFGVRPFDPNAPDVDAERKRVGVDYLNTMVQRYNGNTADALVAYNWGPGNADKWIAAGRDPNALPAETRNYVASITSRLGGGQPQQPVRVAQANTGTATDALGPDGLTATQRRWLAQPMDYKVRQQQMANFLRVNQQQAFQQQQANRVKTPEQMQQDLDLAKARQSNQTVNVAGQENKFNQTLGEGLGKQYLTIQQNGMEANGRIQKWNRLGQMLDQVNTGKYAGTTLELKAAAKSIFGDDILTQMGIKDDVAPAQAAQALSREMALQLRNPSGGAGMPGALSDSDRNFLESMVPSLETTPEGRKLMLDYQIRLSQRERDVARMAADYKRRNNGNFDEGFFQELGKWSDENPMFKASDATTARRAAAAISTPAQQPRAPTRDEIDAEIRRRGLE